MPTLILPPRYTTNSISLWQAAIALGWEVERLANWRIYDDKLNEVINNPQINLPAAVIVDVGKIAGKGWAVIEANSVYSSGLYGCDPMEVIKVIQKANIKNHS